MDTEQIEIVEEEKNEAADETPERPETPEESVKKAVELLQLEAESKEAGTEAPSETKAATETEQAAPESEVESEKEQAEPEKVKPPQRWSAESKEWFNKLPPPAQKEFYRAATEYEGHTNKLWQDLNRKTKEYTSVDEAIEEFLPDWKQRGVTKAQGIRELAVAEYTLRTNPMQGIANLMRGLNVTPEQIAGYLKTGQAPQQQVTPESRELLALREKVAQLDNVYQGQVQQQNSVAVQQVANEIAAVRDALSQDGRYLYPKLHDSEYVNARVKPLVKALKEAQPDLSWGECTKRAYLTLEPGSPSLSQPRLSQAKVSQTKQQRARAVSVAGQSSGAGSQASDIDEAKIPRDATATARMVRQMLMRE